jgi:hypothetical protein
VRISRAGARVLGNSSVNILHLARCAARPDPPDRATHALRASQTMTWTVAESHAIGHRCHSCFAFHASALDRLCADRGQKCYVSSLTVGFSPNAQLIFSEK